MPRCPTNGQVTEGNPTSAISSTGSLPPYDKPSQDEPLASIIGSVKEIKGSIPFINPHLMEAVDHENRKVYMYGGEDPATSQFAADLHVLDAVTMTIEDLSNSLSSRDPCLSLCATENNGHNRERLPVITDGPSFTFLNINDKNFLFLLGGYENGKASSDLIIIDVDNRWWWREPAKGKARPRLEAAIAAVGDRIFIFGGFPRLYKKNENPEHLSSYSILEYVRTGARKKQGWTWVASDVPYPAHVANNDLKFGVAIPVYGGKEILLTPPASQTTDLEEFTSSSMCYFNIKYHSFQPINAVAGSLPKNLAWYYVSTFTPQSRGDVRIENGSSSTSDSQRKRSRPSPYPAPKGRRSAAIDASCPGQSLFICGWNPLRFEDDLYAPELWQLDASFPGHEMTCLNISEKLRGLGAEFHRFIVVDDQILLLGDRDTKQIVSNRREGKISEMEHLNSYLDISILSDK